MITPEYKQELARFHAYNGFGHNSVVPPSVHDIIKRYNPKTVLDYGCATGGMVRTMRQSYPEIIIQGYDPAVAEFSQMPTDADMIYCLDCLEHIEPDHLSSVIDHLFKLSKEILYLEICCVPAKKILSDGRNAHISLHEPDWWKSELKRPSWTLVEDAVIHRPPARPGLIPTIHYNTLFIKNHSFP